MIYYCLELFACAAGAECTGSNITSLVFGTLFMFAQMYFIFQNSKVAPPPLPGFLPPLSAFFQLTIHKFKHIGRLGLMHLVATNLAVWIRLIVVEQFLEADKDRFLYLTITAILSRQSRYHTLHEATYESRYRILSRGKQLLHFDITCDMVKAA